MDLMDHSRQGIQRSSIGEFAAFPGKGLLLRGQLVHIVEQQALLVHQIEPVSGFLFAEALELHFLKDLLHDPHTGGTGTEADEFLVRDLLSGAFQGSQDGGQGHSPGPLDIVVVHGISVFIPFQQTGRVFPAEVFEMDIQTVFPPFR